MNAYIVHTPYHLILSILNGSLRDNSLIIFLDEGVTMARFGQEDVSRIFSGRIHYFSIATNNKLAKIINKNGLLSSLFSSNLSKIRNILQSKSLHTLYVYADFSFISQYLMRVSRAIEVVYIEDGSAAYNSHQIISKIPSFFLKIGYGFWFENVKVLGCSRYISRGLFSYPDLIRVENREKPFSGISDSFKDDLCLLSNIFNSELNLCAENLVIYLIPPYEDEELIALYKSLMEEDRRVGRVPVIKAHPRRSGVGDIFPDAIEIRSYIPTELVVSRIKNLKRVVSYCSTSLISTKFIRPDISVVCILTSVFGCDDIFVNNLNKINVEVLSTLSLY